jgi:Ni/Fe-hydrogenase subunit HybB-like protein
MKIFGILFMLIGFALTVFTTVSIFTKGNVIVAGEAGLTKGSWYSYSWSPLLGIAMIVVGGVLVVVASRTRKVVYS